jgi:hypothetical protein
MREQAGGNLAESMRLKVVIYDALQGLLHIPGFPEQNWSSGVKSTI